MKNYKHSKIAKKVSEKTGYSPALVTVVIAGFFDGIRNLLKKNKNIKIKGLFSFARPLTSEILADVSLILLFFYQIFLSVFSSICLSISKFLYCVSKVSNKKSEEIVNRLWIN